MSRENVMAGFAEANQELTRLERGFKRNLVLAGAAFVTALAPMAPILENLIAPLAAPWVVTGGLVVASAAFLAASIKALKHDNLVKQLDGAENKINSSRRHKKARQYKNPTAQPR